MSLIIGLYQNITQQSSGGSDEPVEKWKPCYAAANAASKPSSTSGGTGVAVAYPLPLDDDGWTIELTGGLWEQGAQLIGNDVGDDPGDFDLFGYYNTWYVDARGGTLVGRTTCGSCSPDCTYRITISSAGKIIVYNVTNNTKVSERSLTSGSTLDKTAGVITYPLHLFSVSAAYVMELAIYDHNGTLAHDYTPVTNGITAKLADTVGTADDVTGLYVYKPAGGSTEVDDVAELLLYQGASMESFTVPESDDFDTLRGGALADITGLEEVTLPSNVKKLGASALSGCTSLYTLNGQEYLTALKDYAIYNTALAEVNLPQLAELGSYALANNTKLKKATVGRPATGPGDYAFANNTALQYVYFVGTGNMVKTGSYAFSGDKNLLAIELPATVKTINQYAFQNCQSLNPLTLTADSVLYQIDAYAFNGCINLTSLTLPETCTYISDNAFKGSYLTEIHFSDQTTTFRGIFGGTSSAVAKIQKINWPSSLASINYSAFTYTRIEDAMLYFTSLSGIGSNTFSHNNCLRRLIFPDTLACAIPGNTLDSNYSSSNDFGVKLRLPRNSKCTSLGNYSSITSLNYTGLVIPPNITSLTNSCLVNDEIKYVLFESSTPPSIPANNDSAGAFRGWNHNSDGTDWGRCWIFVPDAALDAYKTTGNWNCTTHGFPDRLQGIESSGLFCQTTVSKDSDVDTKYCLNYEGEGTFWYEKDVMYSGNKLDKGGDPCVVCWKDNTTGFYVVFYDADGSVVYCSEHFTDAEGEAELWTIPEKYSALTAKIQLAAATVEKIVVSTTYDYTELSVGMDDYSSISTMVTETNNTFTAGFRVFKLPDDAQKYTLSNTEMPFELYQVSEPTSAAMFADGTCKGVYKYGKGSGPYTVTLDVTDGQYFAMDDGYCYQIYTLETAD